MSAVKHVLLGVLAAAAVLAAPAGAQEGQGDVVYVPTPQIVVDEMLTMARVGPTDFVIDLGSGDGRIVITAAQKFGARGIGVDLDRVLLKRARAGAEAAGVSDRAQFVEQNLFETDLSRATVITTYLLPEMNERLRPTILALKPGTRVVAHDYDMGEWMPDVEKVLSVPEKVVGDPGKSYIFYWTVPANLAGKWTSQLQVGGRGVAYELDLEQRYQRVSGEMRVDGKPVRLPLFSVREGDQIRFDVDVPQGSQMAKHSFQGRVQDAAIEGTVTIAGQKPVPWKAQLTERGRMQMSAAGAAAGVPQ